MKKYSAADAKAIIRSYGENWIEFRDDGIYHSPDVFAYDPGEELNWKYVLELDGDDVPNPLTAPCLPFPFTAHELAAFMLDGIGAGVIAANYAGSWESGPDSGMLESFSRLGREAKKALCEAYASIHAAEQAIGSSYPPELQKEVDRLGDECTHAPLDKGIREAFATWRKAMVNYLMRPEPTAGTPALDPDMLATPKKLIEAFGSFTGMTDAWFDHIDDTPGLKAAVRYPGTGGRRYKVPLLDPYKVMLWLVNPRRKKGTPISEQTAWRMLKTHFQKSYEVHAIGDPKQDSSG